MADLATFTAPGGGDPRTAIRATVQALKTVSVGDLLYVGEGYRSRIRERTFAGIDVNGAPFAPYKGSGAQMGLFDRPFYFYPNRDATGRRSVSGDRSFTAQQLNAQRDKARATAAAGRHAKTGRIGVRTPTGIKYESYAAAKSAHGVANVNLFGMEQHPHMLDAMIVKAGGAQSTQMDADFFAGSDEMNVFAANQACTTLAIGFYGDEAERARGHNEGTAKLPKREFFALNPSDLAWGEKAIGERMLMRAKAGR